MDELRPILGLDSNVMRKLKPEMESLPSDPKKITLIALSNTQNVTRLGCCLKLINMYRDMIPELKITSKSPVYIDKENIKFEQDLTVSKKYSSKSITTVYSCALVSIGIDALKHFFNSRSSSYPFAQCLRLLFRYTYFLRLRHSVLTSLRSQSTMGVLNNSLRLCSFRDICSGAQRAALYMASCNPDKVNLKLFAYSIPKRYITDSTRPLYLSFIDALSDDKRVELEMHESDVDKLIQSKTNIAYFSGRTSIDETIIGTLEFDRLYKNVYDDLMSLFLYEFSEDNEIKLFERDFIRSAKIAETLKFVGIQRKFDLIYFVNYEENPNTKAIPKEQLESNVKKERVIPVEKQHTPTRPKDFTMFDMFKPGQNFINDTRKMYIKS